MEIQARFRSQVRNEFFVGVRSFAAQLVVEMNDGKHDTEFGLQFKENAQQRDGVRSSGNRNADTISRAEKWLMIGSAADRGEDGHSQIRASGATFQNRPFSFFHGREPLRSQAES